jgi:hypothetical protein
MQLDLLLLLLSHALQPPDDLKEQERVWDCSQHGGIYLQ